MAVFPSQHVSLVFVILNKDFEVSQGVKLLVYLQFTLPCVVVCDIVYFLAGNCQHIWINVP
jgi:hypothetical protein